MRPPAVPAGRGVGCCLFLFSPRYYIIPMPEKIDLNELDVRHEPAPHRFAVRLDRKVAYLSYNDRGGGVLDYAHTYVPPEYRNRGIALKITRIALEWAAEKGYTIIPSCSFVDGYIGRNPRFKEIVAGVERAEE